MKDAKSFAEILDSLIKPTESQLDNSLGFSKSYTLNAKTELQADFLSRLVFGNDQFKVTLDKSVMHNVKVKYKTENKKVNAQKLFDFVTPVSAPTFKLAPTSNKVETPKSRVKRKLTFDQLNALKVFLKFGESKIDEYSTTEEIKSAYRRLARKYHPDARVNVSDIKLNNAEAFKLISAAYKKLI
ncbi:MAG: DnaJ domain-containing protein [Oligoflexia bacterium]|nr:DnaJ domain-containing protein [Oligoflexia bacterium]